MENKQAWNRAGLLRVLLFAISCGQEITMSSFVTRSIGFAATAAAIMLASTSSAVFAQSSEHDWQKVYAVGGGAASLKVETGDSGLEIHSCGDCKEIRVHVESTQNLNEYSIEEHQEGDHVSFTLKEKPRPFRIQWNASRRTKVTVETPAKLDLDAKVADGICLRRI